MLNYVCRRLHIELMTLMGVEIIVYDFEFLMKELQCEDCSIINCSMK